METSPYGAEAGQSRQRRSLKARIKGVRKELNTARGKRRKIKRKLDDSSSDSAAEKRLAGVRSTIKEKKLEYQKLRIEYAAIKQQIISRPGKHTGFACYACDDKNFLGPRFQCQDVRCLAPSFNLCEHCYEAHVSSGGPWHPPNHSFSRIEAPLASNSLHHALETAECDARIVEMEKKIREQNGEDLSTAFRAEEAPLGDEDESRVEICVVFDCTQSMDPWLDGAKQAVANMAKDVQEVYRDKPDVQTHVCFLGFRDYSEKGGAGKLAHFVSFDWTQDLQALRDNMAKIEFGGGGDVAEDLLGALNKASKLTWRGATKIIIAVTDAPCHGRVYHKLPPGGDKYPEEADEPRGLKAHDIIARIRDRGIKLIFLRLHERCDTMLLKFKEKYDTDNMKMKIQQVADHGTAVEMRRLLQDAVMADKQTRENARLPRERKDFHIVPDIYWERYYGWRDYSAEVWSLQRVEYSEEAMSQCQFLFLGSLYVVAKERASVAIKLSNDPFAEGGMRVAYQMEMEGQKYVAKESLYHGESYNSLEYHLRDMQCQEVASVLAENFNEALRVAGCHKARLQYVPLKVLFVPRRVGNQWLAFEPLIESQDGVEYMKFNNNSGGINRRQGEYHVHALAFGHFSWHCTNGDYMVTDVQGVKYQLTDPQIHCTLGRKFGAGNRQDRGMADFFRSHHCNAVCEALRLNRHPEQPPPGSNRDVMLSHPWHK